jgi:penicillin-binding protein 1A
MDFCQHRATSGATTGSTPRDGPVLDTSPAPAATLAIIRLMRSRASQAALALGCLVASACSSLVSLEPRGADLELSPPVETSVVVDADGRPLAELHAEQDRESVPLAQIPQVVRDAIVAVEDARFYDHGGVDGRAIARALVTNLVEGEIRQGGSTITQQLVKNALTGDAQTLDRKLEEASLALQLESEWTKDQILERYLNTVYFGGGAYGVGAAARRWFDVDVADLDLPQAALLAGMLRAPTRYDPREHPDRARDRRDLVIGLMVEQGLVEPAAADLAAAAPVEVVPRRDELGWRHPYAVDHVLDELQHDPDFHVLGATPSERAARLFGGGLTVVTTIRSDVQRQAEAAVSAVLPDPADPRAALVALDPATGAVLALVGGRDYTDADDPVARFNLATDGRRQPGSAFKPLVLAAALEQGWGLEDALPAPPSVTVPLSGQQPWTVANAGGQGYDDLTLRTATALSVNTVYAQLVDRVGAEAVVDVARRAGIRSPLEPLASIALGAQEVAPIEMAAVAATIAAEGVHHEPTAVQRIVDADGVVIWEHPGGGVQALDAAVARDLTLAMRDVVQVGTGVGAQIGRPAAGKTGTSQDNADAWFTGFTPDLAVAVWVGFPEGRVPMLPPRTRVEVQGGGWPAEIFARFATAALADVVATPFAVDGDLVLVEVDLTRDCLPNPYTPRDLIGERGYVAGTEPTAVCAEPSGPPTVDVPVVEGLRIEQARELLFAAGFTVVEQPAFSSELPPGTVLAQDPAPGAARVLAGSGFLATLTVASGDRTGTVVPELVGLSLDVARRTLEAQGFGVQVRVGCPDGGGGCGGDRAGEVWGQSPAGATAVPVHSTVVVDVYPA